MHHTSQINMVKNTIVQYVKENSPGQNESWIDALTIHADGDCLQVTFPHAFFAPWFFQHKKTLFENAVAACFPKTYTRITYEGKFHPETGTDIPAQNVAHRAQKSADDQAKTLDNFVYNSKNAFCLDIILDIARKSPGTLYTPVVLCGNTGTGKSHIVTALARRIQKDSYPIMLTAARELTQFFALERSPRDFWQTHAALFIDDINELTDKKDLQQSLIHFIDACPENRQIFCTFLGSPDQLNCFEERLTTRLGSGLLLNLVEPDIDVRLQIVQDICTREHLMLNHQQMLFLAQNSTLYRHIQGHILKIQAYKAVHGRILQGDIENIVNSGIVERKISFKDILRRVSEEMHVSEEEILSSKRQSDLVLARQMAMYICRSRLGLSYPELGKIFGGKDHSTVIHAIKKISSMLANDSEVSDIVQNITKHL